MQDQVMQEVEPVNKSKFRRKATEDPNTSKEESLGSSGSQEVNFEGSMELDEDIDVDAFEMEEEPFHYGCATTSVILPQEFMMQDTEKNGSHNAWGTTSSRELVEHLSGVMIQAVRPDQPKRIILEKPSLKMTKHIKPLYIKAHLISKPFSRILVDNGSAINVIPLRLLNALGKSEEDLISTDITVSAFTGEITGVSGVLPIEITVGSRRSLIAFFMVESSASYNALQRKGLDSC